MKVIFCLPGNNFSGRFLDCWSELMMYCAANGIQFLVSRKSSCNIYYVRNMCLGADLQRGKYQKPFDGKVDYDYLMWIDSDMVFNPQHFQKLLNHQKDIVSGIYMMEGGQAYATCRKMDVNQFKEHGHFPFLAQKDLQELKEEDLEDGLLPVSYTGMGWMLVKNGVFESMEYPWFRTKMLKYGDIQDFTMEDAYFCLKAKEKGFKVFVDPVVRVGHEKNVVF